MDVQTDSQFGLIRDVLRIRAAILNHPFQRWLQGKVRPKKTTGAELFAQSLNVIVIPIYKAELDDQETRRFAFSSPHFNGDIVFLAPASLDVSAYRRLHANARFVFLPPQWFANRSTYSSLMTQYWLYDLFESYVYMVVWQFDAVLTGKIPFEDVSQVDYVGAPWVKPFRLRWNPFTGRLSPGGRIGLTRSVSVGNGGLSIRRISAFRKAARLLPKIRTRINEDIIFAFFAPVTKMRIAELQLARSFFMEGEANRWHPGKTLPNALGYHGLEKHNPELEAVLLREGP